MRDDRHALRLRRSTCKLRELRLKPRADRFLAVADPAAFEALVAVAIDRGPGAHEIVRASSLRQAAKDDTFETSVGDGYGDGLRALLCGFLRITAACAGALIDGAADDRRCVRLLLAL